jgi:peptidoglycan/LPS O-acetylase OafA/YrhL
MEKNRITLFTQKARARTLALPKTRLVNITYEPGKYVKELDGWRGISIFFVALLHYFPTFFIGSWIFMELIFVISGFLITGILMDTKSKKNYYKNFLIRRILRIFPLYYLCLFGLFFLLPSSWLDMSYYRAHQLWFWLYAENWLFSIDGWPAVKALRHFWSLAIEEQFYISWPLFVAIFSSKNLIKFCIFLFFFSFLFRNFGMHLGFVMPFPYVATLGRMEGIVLGAIIAILVRTNKSILEKYAYPVTIVSAFLTLSVFAITGTMHMEYPVHYMITYTLFDFFFAGMIVLTICKDELIPFKRRVLNSTFFRQMGAMSYCIYIFHRPIQIIVQENFFKYFYAQTGNENAGKLICVILAILITIPVVFFIHKKIEIPVWNLKRFVK